ncbi:hypothetical protein SteCoe_7493 [Stentor coeruleus]|uniref:Uncharacterized protein n=1 Tax=Stentor coeruleus TaxID=5963 RepID=A0A1R2CMG1_9CILI|nr:hypothetical protein SteCoe_7493 [Stentor coeruleus]
MGGSNSHGSILVQLENSSSKGNEEITGIVHISLKEPFPPSTLYLIFKGKEQTHWTENHKEYWTDSKGKRHSRTHIEHIHGKHLLCNYKHPICVWNTEIQPGGYSIPFSFIIPGGLPGSFYFEDYQKDAAIVYKFHARLIGNNNKKITGKSLINIELNSDFNIESITKRKTAEMKVWCFLKKGRCKINAGFPQNAYSPNQIATVMVEVDNTDSMLPVKAIICRLKYNIKLTSNSGKTTLSQRTLIKEEMPVNIDLGQALLNNHAVEIFLDLNHHSEILQKMYSTRGNIIECIYTIEAEAEMAGNCMCCGEYPQVEVTMNIIPNMPIPPPSVPEAPENWNPQLLKEISITYDKESQPNEITAELI